MSTRTPRRRASVVTADTTSLMSVSGSTDSSRDRAPATERSEVRAPIGFRPRELDRRQIGQHTPAQPVVPRNAHRRQQCRNELESEHRFADRRFGVVGGAARAACEVGTSVSLWLGGGGTVTRCVAASRMSRAVPRQPHAPDTGPCRDQSAAPRASAACRRSRGRAAPGRPTRSGSMTPSRRIERSRSSSSAKSSVGDSISASGISRTVRSGASPSSSST